MIWKQLTLAVILLAPVGMVAATAQAKVVHVSPQLLAGIAAGDQARTIAEAARGRLPGDRVIIHGGTYRETVVVEASGDAKTPITFEAAPLENVVVTGADVLNDWRREDAQEQIHSTPWPHRFVGWNQTHAHPGDEYHRLIGRCEQVFAEHYALRQVLSRDKLSRGTFYADLEGKRLYVWTASNADLSKREARIEAAVRQTLWHNKGKYLSLRGLRFRYAASMAQRGAVQISGDHNELSDCTIEYANGGGLVVDNAAGLVLRRCTFQYNGELGIGGSGAHSLLISQCTIRGNNTKGWNRAWEAGGIKICLSRDVVVERSGFLENRGNGIWFDIGNENATVRNCLIADNEESGIFYEISYGLQAHDNVIVGNGFDAAFGAWGASAGISLSSSPDCRVERNLLVGNKEGFSYREQLRTTPRIGVRGDEAAVWNHDQVVRNNVLAFNRDAQCWGWFDVQDGRHWPQELRRAMRPGQSGPEQDNAREYAAKDRRGQPAGLSLEKLSLQHGGNLYYVAPGQGMFHWGPSWTTHRKYQTLGAVQQQLKFEQGSESADPLFADPRVRDFRVPAGSPAVRMESYPRGEVPGVLLGVISAGE